MAEASLQFGVTNRARESGTAIASLGRVLLKFNRGTVLLLEPPPGLDVAALPGVLWDARVQAHRAPDAPMRRCGRS